MITSKSPAPERLVDAPGAIPGRVSLVLLERHRRGGGVNASRNSSQAGHEPDGLQAQSHLVAVILAADGRAVGAGADLNAQGDG